MSDAISAGGRTIPVSNRGKILFPGEEITKGDRIDYALAIAPKMAPSLRRRPLPMERSPDGMGAHPVSQKTAPEYFPAWITRARGGKKKGTVTQAIQSG